MDFNKIYESTGNDEAIELLKKARKCVNVDSQLRYQYPNVAVAMRYLDEAIRKLDPFENELYEREQKVLSTIKEVVNEWFSKQLQAGNSKAGIYEFRGSVNEAETPEEAFKAVQRASFDHLPNFEEVWKKVKDPYELYKNQK